MKSESGFSFAMASQLFCMVDKEILPSKKVQKSDLYWGPLHGEIGLLK